VLKVKRKKKGGEHGTERKKKGEITLLWKRENESKP